MTRPGLWPALAVALAGHLAVLGGLRAATQDTGLRGAARPVQFQVSFRPVVSGAQEAAPPAAPAAGAAPESAVGQAAAAAEAGPRPAEKAPTASPAAADPVYRTRGELTVGPRPLGPVDVPFPEDVVGLVDLKVQVTLFIDEDGQVQRIRIDTPHVAEPFERAIRASFGAARFSPGQLGEVPVRSQVRLEVAFAAPNAGSRPRRS